MLESVDDLTATSAAALRDRRLDAAETAALERRIRALAAILDERPQELRAIPSDDRRALLRVLNGVRADLVAAEVDGRDASRRADTARRLNVSLLQLNGVAEPEPDRTDVQRERPPHRAHPPDDRRPTEEPSDPSAAGDESDAVDAPDADTARERRADEIAPDTTDTTDGTAGTGGTDPAPDPADDGPDASGDTNDTERRR